MDYIYRIFTLTEWNNADKTQPLSSASLATEGFIHLCTQSQISGVLSRYYAQESSVIITTIDTNKLLSPLRYEISTGGEAFPHLYGLLNVDAIIQIEHKNVV